MDKEFLEDLLKDIEGCQANLNGVANKIKNYMQSEMYRIELRTRKIYIPCANCLRNGEIDIYCNKCGGKGTHAKTKSYWDVSKRMVKVEKITNEKGYGKVYWINKTDFFQASENLLFTTKTDAEQECKLRNKLLDDEYKAKALFYC